MRQKSLFATEARRPAWEQDDAADRLYARVVFNQAVDERFLYEVPYPLQSRLTVGKRVTAPFGRGNRILTGYCVGVQREVTGHRRLKAIKAVVDEQALLSPTMLELAQWIARQYCCSFGQALDSMLPAGVKRGAGTREQRFWRLSPSAAGRWQELKLPPKQRRVLEVLAGQAEPMAGAELARAAGCTLSPIQALGRGGLIEPVRRRVLTAEAGELPTEPATQIQLNEHQRRALERIKAALAAGRFQPLLLHGVTGSGKTEVYLRAIERVVAAGGEAIVLVPEISLTPQTIRRFHSRFQRIAVLHSHLPDAERHAQWERIAAGGAQVIVGARSAVFAPARRLGLIVIDEEHEGTFKQESVPRYHAREVAWRRAELERVPLLLGSATPSLESWHRARTGRCQLLELPERVQNLPLPEVKLIDLRSESVGKRRRGAISLPLEQAMRQALDAGGQVILLLNRRGFSTHIHCYRCGHVEKCPRCDIALVFHRQQWAAVCHFCDLEVSPPEQCPQCQDKSLNYSGLGTERLEQEVRARFPDFPAQRMDADSMRRPGSHEQALAAFRTGRVRILLGTQMIAKGLDFPGVTLVGVVNADTALHLPDFRASERTFQLVAQVAGRTGRGRQPGRVLVQTFSPGAPAIQAASRHDYQAFAEAELAHRRPFGYPPFGRLARLIVRSKDEESARNYIDRLAGQLAELRQQAQQTTGGGGYSQLRLLGPAPAPISRAHDLFRFHLLVQGPESCALGDLLRQGLRQARPPHRVDVAVDVDPMSML